MELLSTIDRIPSIDFLEDSAKHSITFVSMLMHVLVVALTGKKASPAQNRGMPTKINK